MREDFPKDFYTTALKHLSAAREAGFLVMEHTLHCGKCVHKGNEELTVIMCSEGRALGIESEKLFAVAKAFASMLGIEYSEQEHKAE